MNQDNSLPQKVMTAREVSAYLKLPMTTLYEMVSKGKLHAVKCGRQWRFFESDVIRYLRGIENPHVQNHFSEKRFYPRIKSSIQAKLKGLLPETANLILSGWLRDISGGGVRFSLDQESLEKNIGQAAPLKNEHPIEITFKLDEPTQFQLKVKGRIVREVCNGRQGYGIKFRHLSKEDQEVLRNYVG